MLHGTKNAPRHNVPLQQARLGPCARRTERRSHDAASHERRSRDAASRDPRPDPLAKSGSGSGACESESGACDCWWPGTRTRTRQWWPATPALRDRPGPVRPGPVRPGARSEEARAASREHIPRAAARRACGAKRRWAQPAGPDQDGLEVHRDLPLQGSVQRADLTGWGRGGSKARR